jgi:hypothetical protein
MALPSTLVKLETIFPESQAAPLSLSSLHAALIAYEMALEALISPNEDEFRARVALNPQKQLMHDNFHVRNPNINDGLTPVARWLLELILHPGLPLIRKPRRVFQLLTGYGRNWWKASRVVSTIRAQYRAVSPANS